MFCFEASEALCPSWIQLGLSLSKTSVHDSYFPEFVWRLTAGANISRKLFAGDTEGTDQGIPEARSHHLLPFVLPSGGSPLLAKYWICL